MTKEQPKLREYIVVSQIDKETPLSMHIPLHMTMLHWFVSEESPGVVMEQLWEVASRHDSLMTHTTVEALFGPDRDIPVMRVERPPELLRLHMALLTVAQAAGYRLDERWVGEDKWNPHVTHQREGRLRPNDVVRVDDLDLITKDSDGRRRLVGRIVLSSRGRM